MQRNVDKVRLLNLLELFFRFELCQRKQTSLRIERQSGLLWVSYILKNNENTSREINNSFLEVLGPNLRYHTARIQGYVKKNRRVLELSAYLTY